MNRSLRFRAFNPAGEVDEHGFRHDPAGAIADLLRDAFAQMFADLDELAEADESADLSLVVLSEERQLHFATLRTDELPEFISCQFSEFLAVKPPAPLYVRVLGFETGVAHWLAPEGPEAAMNRGYILHAAGLLEPNLQS